MKQKKLFIHMVLFILVQWIPISLCNLRYENLSSLGNYTLSHIWLLIWSITSSSFIYSMTKKVLKKYHQMSYYYNLILKLCLILLIIGVCLPYLPSDYPILSQWHVRFSMFSGFNYISICYYYLYNLLKKGHIKSKQYVYIFTNFILLESYLYYQYNGISTLLEISFIYIISYFLFYLLFIDI